MISKLKYLPINWKNGMSFSEGHLKSQNLANTDSVRDASALHLTSYNYGILGGDGQKKHADAFRDNINNEKAQVSFCRAITRNGSRIEILDNNWEELESPLSDLIGSNNLDVSKYWYLLLVTDLFMRIPEGIEDEKESPRRKPHTRPAYQLQLMSLSDLKLDSLANAIPVAKFESTASGLKKIEDYIPPCARINSHERLIKRYETYDNYLTRLKESSNKIITKVKHKKRSKQSNALSEDIGNLCKKYLDFFVNNYDDYKFSFSDLPPIKLVAFFAKLARVLNHSMEVASDKGHMHKYFSQYATDISTSELNRIIKDTFETSYVHYDLADTLAVVDKFLTTMISVFKALENLDYRELAPRKVVKEDNIITDTYSRQDEPRRRGPDIKIKRPGISENLEDELD